MLRPLQQLIDALRLELRQYGELLAQLDEQPRLARRYIQPDAGWELEAQAEALLFARQSRERWQLQLAWAVARPEASSFEELIPILPQNYRPLVTALVAENESLWHRVAQRLNGDFSWLDRAREISERNMAQMFTAQASAGAARLSTSA